MIEDNYILIFDDTVDIGKEPLPIDDEKTQDVFDKLIKEYKNKQGALCR